MLWFPPPVIFMDDSCIYHSIVYADLSYIFWSWSSLYESNPFQRIFWIVQAIIPSVGALESWCVLISGEFSPFSFSNIYTYILSSFDKLIVLVQDHHLRAVFYINFLSLDSFLSMDLLAFLPGLGVG